MLDHETAHARVGAVIAEKYRLVRLISLGAMGAVYESIHEWTQRHVAVKLLFDEVASHGDSVERFVREARASSKVGHSNIVEVLDLGRDADDTLYLVQELLSGDTLRAEIERSKRLPLREIARCLLPIIDALDAAHAANIVHRDVKPENIVLHRNARGALEPKLIDFGVARLDGKGARLTRAGAILGTPNYMAPEQIRGDLTIDPRADLWAIGVVLYECATGARPFVADNIRELFSKILLEEPAPIEAAAPELPAAFVALVRRALDRDPARRWPSARAMLVEFASIDAVRRDPTLSNTFSTLGLAHDGTRTLVAGSAFARPKDAIAPSTLISHVPGDAPVDQTINVAPAPEPQPEPEPAQSPAASNAAPAVSPPTLPATRVPNKRTPRAGQLFVALGLAAACVAVGAFTLRRTPDARALAPSIQPDASAAIASRSLDAAIALRPPDRDAAVADATPEATAARDDVVVDRAARVVRPRSGSPPAQPRVFIY
jgi:eukaryotic-like serine/threonine-protein kinase